eukprot:GDKK01077215.1.p1 GENE.GDKK01077215.1~~GDKK01077215.1.p1  ORF type:complete len:914 (+),score=397.68 GDKK01077215.1:49-2742(+)
MAPKKQNNTKSQPESSAQSEKMAAAAKAAAAAAAAAVAAAEAARAAAEAQRLLAEAEERRLAEEAAAPKSKGAMKNLRRRAKKAEAVEAEKAEQERYRLNAEELEERYGINHTEVAQARAQIVAELQTALAGAKLPSSLEEFKGKQGELNSRLNAIIARAEEAMENYRGDAVAVKGSCIDPVELLNDLNDLEAEGETDPEHIEWLREHLIKTVHWVAFLAYQKACNEVLVEAKRRLAEVKAAVEAARVAEKQSINDKRLSKFRGGEPVENVIIESFDVAEELAHILNMGFTAEQAEFAAGLDMASRTARNFVQKLKKDLNIIIERNHNHNRPTAMNVLVEAAHADRIKAELAKLDFSGSRPYPNQHNASIGAIIGGSAANIKAAENDCQVLILNNGDHISVHGSQANVAKAISFLDEKIKTILNERKEREREKFVAHDMKVPSIKIRGVSSADLKALEQKAKISNIRIRHDQETLPHQHPGDDATATLTFRVNANDKDAAANHINNFLNKEIVTHDIPLSEAQYNKLSMKVARNRGEQVPPHLRVARDFLEYKDVTPSHIFIHPSKLTLAGTPANIELARPSLAILLARADIDQHVVKDIPRDIIRSIPNIRIIRLEKEIDETADIKPLYSKDGKQDVVLSCCSSKLDLLKEKFSALLEDHSHSVTIDNVPARLMRTLLSNKGEQLHNIEATHSVCISVRKDDVPEGVNAADGVSGKITITGSQSGVAEAEAVLNKSVAVAASFVTKEVELTRDDVRTIIGPRGETIRRISNGLQRADIQGKDTETPKIVLIGAPKAVERSFNLIQSALDNAARRNRRDDAAQGEQASAPPSSEKVIIALNEANTEPCTQNGHSQKNSGEEEFPALPSAGESRESEPQWPRTAQVVSHQVGEELQLE